MADAKPSPALLHNLMVAGELRRAAGALDAAGVDFVALKGIPLAIRLTGKVDGRGRAIRDNDILVRRAMIPKAVSALESIGYSRPAYPVESQLVTNFQYELWKGRLPLEVHWAPLPPLLYPVAEDYVWSRTELFDMGGWSVRVFDKTTTIIQLAAHFVQHGGSFEWILRDLALAWNTWGRDLEPAVVRSVADRLGLRHVLAYSLAAANDKALLDVPPPSLRSRPAELLRRVLPTSELCAPRPQPDHIRSIQMLMLVDPRRIPRWLLLRLLPPVDTLAAQRPLPPGPARYLEYLRRPLRALASVARR